MNRLALTLQNRKDRAPLLGATLHRYDMTFVEMVAMLGFRSIWIEMEHMAITFREATDLCRLGSALGLLTMIRVPDARRESVLKAAECDPDIIDLPMGNSMAELQELVRHARYAPEGDRGFFSSSRATRYGLYNDIARERQRINTELCLMSQIETRHAVEIADELCQVPGIDAVFLGPGDLSTSFGKPGRIRHPEVVAAMDRVIVSARKHERLVAMAAAPGEAGEWAAKGVDLLYCLSDTAALKVGAQAAWERASHALEGHAAV
jgi:4-hydroxy-2-oxoheptanedioate aldolase